MYNAVPVVGIPFRSDQRGNLRRMERRQIAKVVNYRNMTVENLLGTIKEVLSNPVYSKNIKALSKRFKDQPLAPLSKAIFWIEYVIRHGSAEHLVLAARDMDAYATANLDIMAVFLTSIAGIYLAYLFLPTGCRLAFEMLRNHIQAK
ncbi:hypothetical protein ILUMI_17319 [Ignelater luminosus]|uniref:UDP-glucuronosyltransferase n=1 Tax=Ignelater luminosus TaxID=2038154 RepID=A0A8K0G814_IGNLU|nr:hypothetical protein ILUMI_17319 [Ignelater luminosus]